jgi:hypothetical protein
MDLNKNYCKCGKKKSHSEEYDAYYCKSCNEWLEDKCDDPACEYCNSRPATPNE